MLRQPPRLPHQLRHVLLSPRPRQPHRDRLRPLRHRLPRQPRHQFRKSRGHRQRRHPRLPASRHLQLRSSRHRLPQSRLLKPRQVPKPIPAAIRELIASPAPSLQQHVRRRHAPERLAPVTVQAAPVRAITPSQRPRACPVPGAATATAPVVRVRATILSPPRRGCPVRVDAAMMSARLVPLPERAVLVLPPVRAVPVRVRPVRALLAPEHRVQRVPAAPVRHPA